MGTVKVTVLRQIPGKMRRRSRYDEKALLEAGFSVCDKDEPNGRWHMRVQAERRYASREDVAEHATRRFPEIPAEAVSKDEMGGLVRPHLDYVTYVLPLCSYPPVPVPDWLQPGRLDGRAYSTWDRKGRLDGWPDLHLILDLAFSEARQAHGAAVFIEEA